MTSRTLRLRKNSEVSLDDNDSNSSSGIMTRSQLKRLSLSQAKLLGSPLKQAKDSAETTVPTNTRQTRSRQTPSSQDSLDTEPRGQKRSRVVRAIIPAPSEPDSDADASVPAAIRKCKLLLNKVSDTPDEDVKSPKRSTRTSESVKTEASTSSRKSIKNVNDLKRIVEEKESSSNLSDGSIEPAKDVKSLKRPTRASELVKPEASTSGRKSSKNVKDLKRIVEKEESSSDGVSDGSIGPARVTRRSSRKVDRSSVLQTPSSLRTRNTSNESDKSPPKSNRRSSRLVLPPTKDRSKQTELESPSRSSIKLTKSRSKSAQKTKESSKPIEDKSIDAEESVRIRSADFSDDKPIRTSVVDSFSIEEDEDSNDVRVKNVNKNKKISNKQLLDDNENDDLSKIEVQTSRKKSPKVNLMGSPKSVQIHTSDIDTFEHEDSEKVSDIQGAGEKQTDVKQKPHSKPIEPVLSDEEEQHVEDRMKDVDLSDTLEREPISKLKSPKIAKKSPAKTKPVPDQEKSECVGDDDNRLSEAGDGDQHLKQKLANTSPEKSSKSRKLHKKVQQDEDSDDSSLSVKNKNKCFEKDEVNNCASSDHMSSSVPLINTKSRKLMCSKNKKSEANESQVIPVKHDVVEQQLDTDQIQLDSSDFSSAQSVIVSRVTSVSESVGQSVNMKVRSGDRNQMVEEIELVCVKSSDDSSDLNIVGEYVLASKTHGISTSFNENSERSIEKKMNLAVGTGHSTFGFGESNETLQSQNSDMEMSEKTSTLSKTQNSEIVNLMNKSNSQKNKVNVSKKSNVEHKIKAEVGSLSKSSPYTSTKQESKVEIIQDSDSDAESRKAIMLSAQKRIEQNLSTSESDSKHLLRAVHKSLGPDHRDDSSDSDSAPDNVTFEAGRKGVMESLRNAVESIQKEKQRKKERRRERLEKLKLLKEEKLIRLKERLASQEDASCSSSEESGYEEETVDASGKRNKHKMVAKSKSLRIEKENVKEDSKLNKKKPNISDVESDGSGDQKMPASGGLKRLPAEVLDQLPDQIPAKLQKLALQDEKSKKKKKERTEVKIDQEKDLSGFKAPSNLDYIPLKSSGATQFGVVALEKAAKAPKSIAQQAADFRQNMLYGSRLVREPAKNNVIYQQKRKAFSKDRFVR